MRITVLFLAIIAAGCASRQSGSNESARKPASDLQIIPRAQHPTLNLDPQYEVAWGDPKQEMDILKNIGDVTRDSIIKANEQYQKWNDELKRGTSIVQTSEKKRVIGDLPKRPNFATRAVHKKNHGCYPATVTFGAEAPDVGYFRKGAQYDAIIRFSNGSNRNQADLTPDSRGMAVKILPPGTLQKSDLKAMDLNQATLLNVSNVNYPVAFMYDPAEYLKTNEIGFVEHPEPTAVAETFAVQFWAGLNISLRTRVLGGTVGSTVILNPLFQKYYSMAAFRLGSPQADSRKAVKYIFAPCPQQAGEAQYWPAWTRNPVHKILFSKQPDPVAGFAFLPNIDYEKYKARHFWLGLKSQPEYLRAAAQSYLKDHPACFQLQMQSYIDPANTPTEDPTEIWFESEDQRQPWLNRFDGLPINSRPGVPDPAPLVTRAVAAPTTIAKIQIPQLTKQKIAEINGETMKTLCEDLSFNTWDNVPEEHKPLGVVSRMRWQGYQDSIDTRHKVNGVTQQ